MVKVEVDDDIYSVLEARAEEKDFDETEEYVEYLLEQVVEKIKREKEQQESSYSEEEEEEVKKRLRGLGYLD
jgi:predicted nucleotidyltransferase